MPFEQHQEKTYSQAAHKVYSAALKASEALQGHVIKSDAEHFLLEARFPKTILGKTLGERTQLSCQVRTQDTNSLVVIDAYPLDAVERKLMFGARKGVTQTVVTWFIAHLENNLQVLSPQGDNK